MEVNWAQLHDKPYRHLPTSTCRLWLVGPVFGARHYWRLASPWRSRRAFSAFVTIRYSTFVNKLQVKPFIESVTGTRDNKLFFLHLPKKGPNVSRRRQWKSWLRFCRGPRTCCVQCSIIHQGLRHRDVLPRQTQDILDTSASQFGVERKLEK
ncbi:hypothetical protein J6590_019818 [Homalodisca vitripennis]|nr:hypothetical protein J6590_019818 [Homalodisca vitripennis]